MQGRSDCVFSEGGRSSGFTLIELIMAMFMAMVVLAGTVLLFSTSNRAFVGQDQIVTLEQNVRGTMEIMTFELHMAGYVPGSNQTGGTSPIVSDVSGQSWSNGRMERIEEATAGALTFVADLNADDDAETVRYTLIGTALTRESWQWDRVSGSWSQDAGGPVAVAFNVSGLNLGYIFEDGDSGLPDDADAGHNK